MRREYYQKSNSKIKLKYLLSSLSIRPIRDSNISNWQREVCFLFLFPENLQKENFAPDVLAHATFYINGVKPWKNRDCENIRCEELKKKRKKKAARQVNCIRSVASSAEGISRPDATEKNVITEEVPTAVFALVASLSV